jgi:regulator of CtrA degradation
METATRFFGKTYDETMALLVASRDYLANAQPAEARGLKPIERLRVNCEAMRLTTRLTQIMAWLLAQRAVHEGEITREKAAGEEYRLTAEEVCLAEMDCAGNSLPPRLCELLDQSRRLYVRVARLDEMARRTVANPA